LGAVAKVFALRGRFHLPAPWTVSECSLDQ